MNRYNLSVVRYDNGSKSGKNRHEFAHIELSCNDIDTCKKFEEFCKKNNIEKRIVVDCIIEFENGVRTKNEYPIQNGCCIDYTYDEYIDRLEKAKLTD